MDNAAPRRIAPVLWFLLAVFILRVVGQMFVAAGMPGFLPPMEEWQSGILPYPLLVVFQLLIIALFGKICLDMSGGKGFFSVPKRLLGKGLLIFGAVYLAAMISRYIIRMALCPEARWFGGTIPIFLHCDLAVFILIVGRFHYLPGR